MGIIAYLARNLTKSQMGGYSLSLVFISLFCVLMCFYVNSGYQRYFFDFERKERDDYELSLLNILAIIAFSVCSLLWIAESIITPYLFEMSQFHYRLLLLIPLFYSFTEVILAKLRSTQKRKTLLLLQLARSSLFFLLLYAFFEYPQLHTFFNQDPLSAVFLAMLLSFSIFVLYYIKTGPLWRPIINFGKIKAALSFSISFIPVHMGVMLYLNSDKYMLEKFMTMEVVGIYTAISLITSSIIIALMGPIFDSFYPIILKEKENQDFKSAHKIIVFGIQLLALTLVFTLSILPKESTLIILGGKYLPHAKLIFGFIPIVFCQFLSQLLSYNFHLKNKIWLLAIFELSLAAVNIMMNLVLIPNFGLKGALVASAMTMLIKLVLVTLISKRLLPEFSISARNISLCLLSALIVSGLHYLCFEGALLYRIIILICEYILLAILFYKFLEKQAPEQLKHSLKKLISRP